MAEHNRVCLDIQILYCQGEDKHQYILCIKHVYTVWLRGSSLQTIILHLTITPLELGIVAKYTIAVDVLPIALYCYRTKWPPDVSVIGGLGNHGWLPFCALQPYMTNSFQSMK